MYFIIFFHKEYSEEIMKENMNKSENRNNNSNFRTNADSFDFCLSKTDKYYMYESYINSRYKSQYHETVSDVILCAV